MKKQTKKIVASQDKAARKTMLEELFQDFYKDRMAVYRMNFIRGIAFGLGSVLGGTIVVALLIWLLTFLAQFIPSLSDFFNGISVMLDSTKE